MKLFSSQQKGEQGYIVVVALVILTLLSIIGISASRTTSTELLIARNEKSHKVAFYAAEAARGYVARNTTLYGTDHITVGGTIDFPNPSDSAEEYLLNTNPKQSFKGNVEYLGSFPVPRGKGFEAGKFRAHKYKMTCYGYSSSNAQSKVETGFFRVGF
jgi:hypothetical protein